MMLLGIPGDNTFSNYQEAQRIFFLLASSKTGGSPCRRRARKVLRAGQSHGEGVLALAVAGVWRPAGGGPERPAGGGPERPGFVARSRCGRPHVTKLETTI